MNKVFISFFIMTSFVCNKDNTATLTGKWRLIKYHNLTARTIESEPANINRSIIIEFSDNGYKGKMNGHTVSNRVSGEYELFKKNKMKILSLIVTEVGEPYWGNKFGEAMQTVSSYKRYDKKLFIFFSGDREKMEFKKE